MRELPDAMALWFEKDVFFCRNFFVLPQVGVFPKVEIHRQEMERHLR